MALLRRTRAGAFEMLRDSARPVPQRLTLLLMYGYHVQAIIDGAEPAPFDPGAALAEAREFARESDIRELTDFYGSLEILTERWKRILECPTAPDWDEMLCNLAQYGVFRHYLQAVYDWDLSARIKRIVAGCILCAHLPGKRAAAIQLWAKETESSGENAEAILDAAWTHPALTDAKHLGFLGNT